MAKATSLVLVATIAVSSALSVEAADLGRSHPRRHHRQIIRVEHAPPPGYAYGGYANGPGPGWVESDSPGFAPGMTPGWGYIPAGAPPVIFDPGS